MQVQLRTLKKQTEGKISVGKQALQKEQKERQVGEAGAWAHI